MICDHLLEVPEFQFLAGRPIDAVQVIAIEEAQLDQIEDGFLGPFICAPCNGIIIDHLIKQVNASHEVDVISDEFRPLHCHLLIHEFPCSFHPSSVGEILCACIRCRSDTRHQSYVLPNKDQGVALPAECHLPTGKLFDFSIFFKDLGAPLGSRSVPITCVLFSYSSSARDTEL